MPGQQETIELFNVPQNVKDADAMVGLCQKIDEQIKGMTSFTFFGRDANSSQQFKQQSQQIQEALLKIAALEKELESIKQKSSATGKRRSDEELRASEKLRAETKSRVDAIKAEDNAYVQLRQKVAQLNAEYRQLAAQYGKNSEQAKAAQASALQYQGQLNKINEGLNQHQHNVGNYLGSIKNFFGDLIRQAVAFFGIFQAFEFLKGSVEEFAHAQEESSKLENILSNLNRLDVFQKLKKDAGDFAEKFKSIKPEDVTGIFDKLITFGKLTENQIRHLTPVIIDFAAKTHTSLESATSTIIKAMEGNVRGLREFGIEIKRGNTAAENFGIIMKDLAPRLAGAREAFENTAAGFGEKLKVKFDEIKKSVGEAIASIFGFGKTSDDVFADDKFNTNDQQEKLDGLLKRYDELKDKASLNTTQQEELRGVIQKITEIVPEAATEFNKYGEALDINKGKVEDFIKVNKQILAEEEYKVVEEHIENIKDNLSRINKIRNELNDGGKSVSSGVSGVGSFIDPLTKEERKQDIADIRKYQIEAVQLADKLKEKYGKDLPDGIRKTIEAIKSEIMAIAKIPDPVSKTGNKVLGFGDDRADKIKKEKYELEDYAKEFQKILDQINSFAEKALGIDVSPLKRELNAAFIEYDKFFMSIRDLRNNDEKDITKKLAEKKITAVQAASQRKIVEEKSTLDLLNLEKAYNANVAAITEKYRREAAEAARKNDEEHFKKQEEMFDKIQALLDKKAKQRFKDDVAIAKINVDDPKSPGTNLQKQKKEFEAEMNLEIEEANEQHNHGLISETEYQELLAAIRKHYDDKVRDAKVKAIQRDIDYARNAIDAVDNLEKAKYERQLNRIQKQIDANNKLKENETERISTSTLSEQQKANALIVLNARTAAQNEALARKQRDIKIKEAKFDKDKAIFEIIANTAIAITKDLGSPWKIAIDAAIGAVQLAAVVAKPIPTYFKGTDDHPGGAMIVGELGSELITTPDGKQSLSPDKPTLMFAPKGTEVLTAKETHDKLNDVLLRNIFRQQLPQVQINLMDKKIDELKQVFKDGFEDNIAAIKKQKHNTTIIIDSGFNAYINKVVRS